MKGLQYALLSAIALFSSAGAQQGLPESLKAVIPEYPGSAVTLCVTGEEGAKVHLEVSAPPGGVADFYKKAMGEKGWEVEAETAHEGGIIVVLRKGGSSLNIAADGDAGGKTRLVLTLTDS